MSMTIAIHHATHALAGHAARHPLYCVGEALLAVTLVAFIWWAAMSASNAIPGTAPPPVVQERPPPVGAEGPDARTPWPWPRRVTYPLYEVGPS
jgi:hypothetical protein